MAYPQNLLAEGETVEFELKPHWRALIVPAIVLVIDVFLLVWLFVWASGLDNAFGNVFKWVVVLVGLGVLVFGTLLPFARWMTTQYVFTTRRLITREGLVSKTGRDMPLSKVNNVSFRVSALGRMLNFGDLTIQSAGEDGDLLIRDVPNVEVIQREIYRMHEEDDERRRRRLQAEGDYLPPADGT